MDLKKYLFPLENPRHSNKWISGKELIERWDIRDFELFDLMKKGLQAYNSYGKKITDSDSLERAPRYTLDQTEGLIRGIEVTRRVLGKPGTFQRPRSEWEIKAEARKAYEAQSLEIVNPPKDHELMSFCIPQNRKMADKMLSMGRSFLFRIEEALNFEKEQGLSGLSNYLEISPPKQKTDLNNEVPEGETPTNARIYFADIEMEKQKEKKDHENTATALAKDFISNLMVAYASDTSVILMPQGGKSKEYSCQDMGFKSAAKTWKMFIDVLQKDDHKYHVGIYSKDRNPVKNRGYNNTMSVLKEFSKKFIIFLNKTYSMKIPATLNVFENIYRKGQDRAGTYVPKFEIFSPEVDSGKLSKDETLKKIEALGAQLKKEKNDKIKKNLMGQIMPFLRHAANNNWITERMARNYIILTDESSQEDAFAYVDPWAAPETPDQ